MLNLSTRATEPVERAPRKPPQDGLVSAQARARIPEAEGQVGRLLGVRFSDAGTGAQVAPPIPDDP
jgi:hypothetical protein